LIRVGDNRTEITIFEGKVVAANDAGTLSLTGGESAVAIQGQAPAYRTIVKPRDAVQWALYYPPVMEIPPDDFAGRETNDPRVLTGRAASSLAVGRVDEASADLDQAIKSDPNNSDALALQAIIAVTQNEKEKALNLAQQAVQANPKSSPPLIAQSYAQQANFDLEGARASLEKAVEANPNDALAWARLAEIQSSFGETDKAIKTAEKAVALNPNLSRTQTVLGFAYLMNRAFALQPAMEAFQKAIEFDQADPLPRLGLGLAKIRDWGGLEDGRAELEIAATLDPNNAMIRSYLGKAFFEEKRDHSTETEYTTAKELDPKDPTPFFYDALQKQLTNRPVEALQDMEKAIELNNNRAVYRSRLLLDSDEAARSAGNARVYSDLGFQQLALVEGWKSVNIDPTNNSAHRFLADSYAILPRHEIARVSELLQSQLLQPLNTTPIQPSLVESNLFLIAGGGPGTLSFNEFNTLMVSRNRLALMGSGLVGGNDTHSEEAIMAGIHKTVSFSVGYSHFETDGWRTNADQNDDIFNAFVQWELTPKTSIQGEYRNRNNKRGETRLRFFEDDFRPDVRQKLKTETARFGFHHTFAPSSHLIGNYTHQNLTDTEKDQQPGSPPFGGTATIDGKADQDANGIELSHLFRSQVINVTTGGGYFKINGNDTVTADLCSPLLGCPPFPPLSLVDIKVSRDADHKNLYLYSYINLIKNMTLTLGASGDFFKADSSRVKDKNQFNPKAGIIWNPIPSTTIRGAVFRTLKRTLITDQTLEPTQVAGFNQFFDDFNTTDAWRYGGAVNQKFGSKIYGGVQWSKRDLDVQRFDIPSDDTKTVKWDEKEWLAYLFWTPHEWVSLSAQGLKEKLDRNKSFADGAKKVTTYYVPLGINAFHPTGLSASFRGTYVHQKGDFERATSVGTFQHGKDDFWLLDATINFRLPKRYGLITIGGTNLTDKKFEYFDSDHDNARIQPDRFFFAKATLALP
jgi:tetratricopeptide (TPR) repeat protein